MGYLSISAPNECILAHLKKSHSKLIYKDLALTLREIVRFRLGNQICIATIYLTKLALVRLHCVYDSF